MCSYLTSAQRSRFFSKCIQTSYGCIEWMGSRKRNLCGEETYGQFWCGRIGIDGRMRLAHRVAWEIANGSIPNGMDILHSCDNRICVNPAHLSAGTAKMNYEDMVSKGRRINAKGERHGCAKLTDEDVKRIRKLRAQGVPRATVANEFCVSISTVQRITNGKRWTHV